MMTERAESLRQAALEQVRAGSIEQALPLYDQALALAEDEALAELITINKADALIASGGSGPEVEALPLIVMRRRKPRHVYLAAYALQYKFHLEGNSNRAIFYGQVASRAAEEAGQLAWQRVVDLELGNILTEKSQFADAAEAFRRVLANQVPSGENCDLPLSHDVARESLGYCLILMGDIEEGMALVQESLHRFTRVSDRVEAYIDLCYGSLELERYEEARQYGQAALAEAIETRHVRNAHYLLGETALKEGDFAGAEAHFDALSQHYPEFRNLKSLLFAIDLRSMVNFRL